MKRTDSATNHRFIETFDPFTSYVIYTVDAMVALHAVAGLL